MIHFGHARFFALRNWIGALAAFSFFKTNSVAMAQSDSTANPYSSTNAATNALSGTLNNNSAPETTLEKQALELRLGPFDLHPRLAAGLTYDDNVLLTTANKEADTVWTIQPAIQAVAGDDAALIAYRDQNNDILSLSPGNLIFQEADAWPGRLLILDYGPGFQFFDKYTANNSIDEFATFNLLLPLDKLILGIKQDYQLQKTDQIEFDERTTVETVPTTLSAAYKFDDKTSFESDLRRVSIGYDQPGLTGYTEYNTEDWLNYAVVDNLPVSLGVLAGLDDVTGHQDQTFEQFRVRARYDYTQKLTFDVSVGGELRQFENGLPETLSSVFDIACQYQLAERTWLQLSGSRQQYASIYNGYNYASTGATLEVRQGITDRFTVTLSAGYNSLDFTPITTTLAKYTGNYYVAEVSLDVKIVRHLTGQFFYQTVGSHSQINAAVYDNQTGIKLTLNF